MAGLTVPSEIIAELSVGDERSAMAPDVHDFGCIVNATNEVPFSKLMHPDTIRMRIDVLDVGGDGEQDVLLANLPGACSLIRECREKGIRVLVHCAESKQRSCTVVVAYLMYEGLCYSDAMELMKKRHEKAFDYGSYVHFQTALDKWGDSLRRSDNVTTLS